MPPKDTFLHFQCLLCISDGVLVYLEYPSKPGRLHQGLDYILYLQHNIDCDCITVLKV